MEHALRTIVFVLALTVTACGDRPASAPAEAPTPPVAAAPVRTALTARSTVTEILSAPGHTAATAQQKVRAPFAGTLAELRCTDGDRVAAGQVLGTVISRDSLAALSGAREMAREAKTDSEKEDAARAVALAERQLVRAPLSAASDGVVLSHAAVAGDRVSDDQDILTIADAGSIVFIADVAQSDLRRVRPGQSVTIELAGRTAAVAGRVHDVQPSANAGDFTAPVRINLGGLAGVPPLGLFGTARIVVGEHHNASVVPDDALVRDDLTGVSRIALVRDGKIHWIEVTPGAHEAGATEILAPRLSAGESVVVSGQLGLPEGAAVAAAR